MNKKSDSLGIDRIAFFGRTYAEYLSMFGLNEQLLRQGAILNCPAGASSFAAEAHQLGLDAKPYPYLNDILSFLDSTGIKAEIVKVPFEFQKGANQMIKLIRKH